MKMAKYENKLSTMENDKQRDLIKIYKFKKEIEKGHNFHQELSEKTQANKVVNKNDKIQGGKWIKRINYVRRSGNDIYVTFKRKKQWNDKKRHYMKNDKQKIY